MNGPQNYLPVHFTRFNEDSKLLQQV